MAQIDISTIDLNLLVALAALIETRSVTRAARRLRVTQSTMSHTLARLRGLLEDPVLVRTGRAMELTPRAEALASPLRRTLGEITQLLAAEPGLCSIGERVPPHGAGWAAACNARHYLAIRSGACGRPDRPHDLNLPGHGQMAMYSYKAVNDQGRVAKGLQDAANVVDLELRLKRMGLELVHAKIDEKKPAFGSRKIRRSDLITFFFNMEQLLRAGVPLLECLGDLRDSMDDLIPGNHCEHD